MSPPFPLAEARALFEAERYLDAHAAVGPAWSRAAILALDADGKVFAGRYARWLGSERMARRIFRQAERETPEHPLVRYFSLCTRWPRRGVWWALRHFRRHPELPGADAAIQAEWIMARAYVSALVRDFALAHALTERALDLAPRNPWVHVERARALALEDRRDEAVAAADAALALRPGYSLALLEKVTHLWHLGRFPEALALLDDARARHQSYYLHLTHACFLLSHADLCSGAEERRAAGARALAACHRARAGAPLADPETVRSFHALLADAHYAAGDLPAFKQFAAQAGPGFFASVLASAEAHPAGTRLLLPHTPVYQSHDTCVPASLATAVSTLGAVESQQLLADEMTYGGTAMYLVRPWAEKHGLVAREFVADPAGLAATVTAGFPCVVASEYYRFGHARALVGVDTARGTALFHDPGRPGTAEALLAEFCNGEAPLGPIAVALARPERRAALEALPLAASAEVRRMLEVQRLLDDGRVPEAVAAAAAGESAAPASPLARYARALAARASGDIPTMMERARSLHAAAPGSIRTQNLLLLAVEAVRNPGEARRVLDAIVAGRLPDGSNPRDGRLPTDTSHGVRLANYLRVAAPTRARARWLFEEALRKDPMNAPAFHSLGDLLWDAGQKADAELAMAAAATLEDTHDHFAEAYADVARELGHEAAGLAYLEARARRLGPLRAGHRPWIGWIGALQRYGHGEAAERALTEALAARPEDGELAAFAATQRAAAGRFPEAQELLRRAERHAPPAEYRRAAMETAERAGLTEEAWSHVLAWCAAAPADFEAWRRRVRLLGEREGPLSAAELTRSLCGKFAGDDAFESLHLERLATAGEAAERLTVLRERLRRNPDDAWAWRELGIERVETAARRTGGERETALAEAAACLVEARRTDPAAACTRYFAGLVAFVRGDRAAAIAAFTGAVEDAPDYEAAFRALFGCVAAESAERKRELAQVAERIVTAAPAQRTELAGVAALIREALGPAEAEAMVERVAAAKPADAELIVARAEARLLAGQGRTGAQRAAALLRPALQRYPDHLGLRVLLAKCELEIGDAAAAVQAFREVLARAPCHGYARRQLAAALFLLGEDAGGIAELTRAAELEPLSPAIHLALAQELAKRGRMAEAIGRLEAGLRRLPEVGELWDLLGEYQERVGGAAARVETARRFVQAQPDSAAAHQFLGGALARLGAAAPAEEVAAAFARATELNVGSFDARDELCMFLAQRGRFEEALRLCAEAIPALPDPVTAAGRRAWLLWRQGRRAEGIEAMKQVVGRRPEYRWGWLELLGWMVEQGQHAEAAQLAPGIAPALSGDLSVRFRVLEVQAGCRPEEEVSDAWERLSADFPEVEQVAVRHADWLIERRRFGPATRLLEAAHRRDPGSPWVLVGLVQAALGLGQVAVAVAHALDLFRRPVDDFAWPARLVWESFGQAKATRALIERTSAELVKGTPLRRRAVWGLVWALRQSNRGKELKQTFEFLARSNAYDAETVATALSEWGGAGRQDEVAAWIAANRERCNADRQLWQAVGWVLNRYGRYAECVPWLGDWARRGGAEQWAVYNLADAHGALGEWPAALAVHEAALKELAWDHSAPRHRAMVAAYKLLLGRRGELGDLLENVEAAALGDSLEQVALAWVRELGELESGEEGRVLAGARRVRGTARGERARHRELASSKRFRELVRRFEAETAARVTTVLGRLRLAWHRLTDRG
ncbi:MAG: hypothetical protein HZA54_19900 [Planctomycetes bacterium]|nr:hypothetical protein [Planctomycetota bacterium]